MLVLPLSPLGEAKFMTQEGDINVTFFECEPKSSLGKVNKDPKVHSTHRWVKVDDFEKLDWVGASREFAKWFVEYNRDRFRGIFIET